MRNLRKLSWSAASFVGIVSLAAMATYAVFSGTTANSGNSWSAGTVTLTDNDSGSALFSVTNMKPGDLTTKCIKVTLTGSLTSTVKFYTDGSGTALAPYLDVKVTVGQENVGSPTGNGDCTSFAADTGVGTNGVVFDADLADLGATYAAGTAGPNMDQNDYRLYKFETGVEDNNAAQGLSSSSVAFTWEARNV